MARGRRAAAEAAAQAEAQALRDAMLAAMPDSWPEAIAYYWCCLERYDAARRAGDDDAATAIDSEAHLLAQKMNDGVGICADPWSAGHRLMDATASKWHERPLWGQQACFPVTIEVPAQPRAGRLAAIDAQTMRVRVSVHGLLSMNGFEVHAVDRDRPFLSETGYRSFLGFYCLEADATVEQYVRAALTRHIATELHGRPLAIKAEYRERTRHHRDDHGGTTLQDALYRRRASRAFGEHLARVAAALGERPVVGEMDDERLWFALWHARHGDEQDDPAWLAALEAEDRRRGPRWHPDSRYQFDEEGDVELRRVLETSTAEQRQTLEHIRALAQQIADPANHAKTAKLKTWKEQLQAQQDLYEGIYCELGSNTMGLDIEAFQREVEADASLPEVAAILQAAADVTAQAAPEIAEAPFTLERQEARTTPVQGSLF